MPRTATLVLLAALLLASCSVSISSEEAKEAFKLAYDNQHGINMKIDLDKAAFYYRKAADGGVAEAQFNLGNMYFSGSGVALDASQAVEWFRKAAEQGLPQAQYNLANAYRTGKGVKQDYERALQWYRNAADKGLAEAQFNLGAMYGNGEGVPQDYAEAYYWLLLSSKQGYAKAGKYLENFRPDISPATRTRIEQEVRDVQQALNANASQPASSSAASAKAR